MKRKLFKGMSIVDAILVGLMLLGGTLIIFGNPIGLVLMIPAAIAF